MKVPFIRLFSRVILLHKPLKALIDLCEAYLSRYFLRKAHRLHTLVSTLQKALFADMALNELYFCLSCHLGPWDGCSPDVNHLGVLSDETHLPFFGNLLVPNKIIYVSKPILKVLQGLVSVIVASEALDVRLVLVNYQLKVFNSCYLGGKFGFQGFYFLLIFTLPNFKLF